MRRSHYTEAQVIAMVREYDAGTSLGVLSRKHDVHANTIRLTSYAT